MNAENASENDAALWIDAGRERTARINAAVRELQEAEDDLTRLPTWGHLSRSAEQLRDAADRLIAVIAEARVIPPEAPAVTATKSSGEPVDLLAALQRSLDAAKNDRSSS